MSSTIELAKALIACPSVTPDDSGCQAILQQRLTAIGFTVEPIMRGDVSNFWAYRGNSGPIFTFAGHTDVVPPGPLDKWQYDPFKPTIVDGMLIGRGAADMKGSLAAMVTACEQFVAHYPQHQGIIGFMITSDEEGTAINGTCKIVDYLQQKNITPDWCIVGEPTSEKTLGDTIKVGRRGSLSGELIVYGKQGHIAYPHKADNPIHRAMRALCSLTEATWDKGNEHFPPTSFQISNINSGTGATNVIPHDMTVLFNLRFSPELSAQMIQDKIEHILGQYEFNYDINWHLSAKPFITQQGKLTNAAIESIQSSLGTTPILSTSGGTSDGRFIAPLGTQVVELGPINASIHQINEHVNIQELDLLAKIYEDILINLLSK